MLRNNCFLRVITPRGIDMKQKLFMAFVLFGIILASGCIGSSIADKIPTENLPGSLKLENKVVTDEGTSFVFNSSDGVIVSVVVVDETGADAKKVYERLQKIMSATAEGFNMDEFNKRNNLTTVFNEEALLVDGLSVKHIQTKDGGTKEGRYYASKITDIYFIQNDTANILISAYEDLTSGTSTSREYRGLGLELTKMIVQNLKK